MREHRRRKKESMKWGYKADEGRQRDCRQWAKAWKDRQGTQRRNPIEKTTGLPRHVKATSQDRTHLIAVKART